MSLTCAFGIPGTVDVKTNKIKIKYGVFIAGCKLFKDGRKTMVSMRRYYSFNAEGVLVIAVLMREIQIA